MNLVIPLTNDAKIILIILGNGFWQPHTIKKGKNLLWRIPASMYFIEDINNTKKCKSF